MGRATVIVDLRGVGMQRPAEGLNFSDLTSAVVVGAFRWLGEGLLEIPFDPEPTPAEQDAIRRRLLTRDEAQETRLVRMREVADALADDDRPLAKGVRLLLEERLAQLKETH